jgi:hypothetical protein
LPRPTTLHYAYALPLHCIVMSDTRDRPPQ